MYAALGTMEVNCHLNALTNTASILLRSSTKIWPAISGRAYWNCATTRSINICVRPWISDRALSWIRSYLDNRSQTVLFNGKTSSRFNVPHDVPQRSVLGPVLFVLYTADIGIITPRHDLLSHFYADDSQLYVSCRQNSIQATTSRLNSCLSGIDEWMASNRLKLNQEKTDIPWCATKRRLRFLDHSPLLLSGTVINPSAGVKDLEVIISNDLSMTPHVNLLVSQCFYQLRRIKNCCRTLPRDTVKTLVNSFVISCVDSCNCLLEDTSALTTNKLQRVLNAAAKVIYGGRKFDHVTLLLRDKLH